MLWPEPLNWWAYQQHLLSFRAANYKKKRCHLHTLGFQLQDKQIERLFNYRQNRSGPRIYPCGTPVGNFRKWILLLCFINIEHTVIVWLYREQEHVSSWLTYRHGQILGHLHLLLLGANVCVAVGRTHRRQGLLCSISYLMLLLHPLSPTPSLSQVNAS